VWALGVFLYAMLCGTFPYKGATDKELYKKITKGEFYLPDFLSEEAKELLKLIMKVNADERPSADEIL